MYFKFIPHALSPEFCCLALAQIQSLGFEKAQVNVYGTQQELTAVRNNLRLELQSQAWADLIDNCLKSEDFPLSLGTYQHPSSDFRAYLYRPGEYFKPHRDGSEHKDGLTSKVTCLVYLNDTQGGQTVLMPDGYSQAHSHIGVTPTQGSILLFEHRLWHEGKSVESGEKYVLRTNLLFGPVASCLDTL